MQNFASAVLMYEQLTNLYPEVEDYQVYYAQSLYKAGQHDDAARQASMIEGEQHTQRVNLIRASIYYELNDVKATRSILESCLPDDPTTLVFDGAIEYKEKNFEEARKKFSDAMDVMGYQSELAYNVALCYYQQKQHGNAMNQIAEIIEKVCRSCSLILI